VGVMNGKTAIVTGGGNGVGGAVARRFAAEGVTVAILDDPFDAANQVATDIRESGGDAFAEVCDVSRPRQVARAVEAVVSRCGDVSALVNSAGTLDKADFLDIEADSWQRVVDLGLTGSFLVTHDGGAIVCIASICAHMAEAAYTSYNAVNGGMLLLVKSAAVDLGKYGIRINSVSPGYIDSPEEDISSPELLDYLRHRFSRVPLRRLVRPEEVAAACLFLCSDEASAITGTDLVVDCGTLANSYVPESFPADLQQP
jgi:NAD(P)-dependent dehydrogenase (short-subunit alcohol dehydrogenase family)